MVVDSRWLPLLRVTVAPTITEPFVRPSLTRQDKAHVGRATVAAAISECFPPARRTVPTRQLAAQSQTCERVGARGFPR